MPTSKKRSTTNGTTSPSSPRRDQRSRSSRRTFLVPSFIGIFSIICYFAVTNDWVKLRNPLSSHLDVAGSNSAEEGALFAVAKIPGKGMGLVALRDIEQGQLLIREKPVFIVPSEISSSPSTLIWSSLSRVTPAERQSFFNLSYVHFPEHLRPEEHPEEVALAIFQTNAVAAGDGVGIFPRMARLNHGCSSAFNSVYSWRESEKALVVHALKRIHKGQELLTTYTDTKRPRDQRRRYLSDTYGFHCTCAVCSLPPEQSKQSDNRLNAMSGKYQRLSAWGQGSISGPDAIKLVNEIWALGEEEGYWSERGRLAADAAWVAAAHSDVNATREWALLALRWYSYELGGDSEQAREMESVVQRPQSHRAWRTRGAASVGEPKVAA